MVAFFEVITFFGVAAFFAWLEFLSLLNDIATQFDRSESLYRQEAKHNLVGISDFFLASFVFYSTAIGANYLYHNGVWIGPYYFTTLYHSPVAYIIFAVLFPVGILTFCVPIFYIRSILRGDRNLLTKPVSVSGTLGLCYIAGLSLGIDWLGYISTQFPYSDVVWLLAGCLTVLGIYLTIKRQRRFGAPLIFVLVFAPIWVWVLVSAFLYLIRFLPSLH